jgi:hypothetical protein
MLTLPSKVSDTPWSMCPPCRSPGKLLPGLRSPSLLLLNKVKFASAIWLTYAKIVRIHKQASLNSLHVASCKINALRSNTLTPTS